MLEGFKEYRVGKPLDVPSAERFRGIEAVVMEACSGGGFMLHIFLPDITKEEVLVFRKSAIEFRYIEAQGFILLLIGFDRGRCVFEMEFDPTAYPNRPGDTRHTTLDRSNLLQILAVDSATMIIKAIRVKSIAMSLFKLLTTYWRDASTHPNYSMDYRCWMDDVRAKYDVTELWRQANKLKQY